MKKLVLSAVFLLVLLGCENGQNDNDNLNSVEESDDSSVEANEKLVTFLEDVTFSVEETVELERSEDEIISAKDAFSIMVSLVADILEIEMAGMHIELAYRYNPYVCLSSWIGLVFRDVSHVEVDFMDWNEETMPIILVELDALSGQGRRIHSQVHNSKGPVYNMTWEEVYEMTNEELFEFFQTLNEVEIEEALNIAYDIAHRFFEVNEVIDVSFGFFDDEPIELETFVGDSLPFTATNDQGQMIEILLLRNVNELFVLHTTLTDEGCLN